MNRLYEIEGSLKINGTSLEVQMCPDEKLKWFEGHFPAQKILPGIVQLKWVRDYGAYLTKRGVVCEIPQVKFTLPVGPGELISLSITALDQKDRTVLNFTYSVYRGDRFMTASQGKIVLC